MSQTGQMSPALVDPCFRVPHLFTRLGYRVLAAGLEHQTRTKGTSAHENTYWEPLLDKDLTFIPDGPVCLDSTDICCTECV